MELSQLLDRLEEEVMRMVIVMGLLCIVAGVSQAEVGRVAPASLYELLVGPRVLFHRDHCHCHRTQTAFRAAPGVRFMLPVIPSSVWRRIMHDKELQK